MPKTWGFTLPTAQRLKVMAGPVQSQVPQPQTPQQFGGTSGGRIKHVKSPGSVVAAFNTSTLVMSSASFTEYADDGTGTLVSGSSITCFNPGPAIPANTWCVAQMNEKGNWIARPVGFDVRVNTGYTKLQKTNDGTNWTDWADIAEC